METSTKVLLGLGAITALFLVTRRSSASVQAPPGSEAFPSPSPPLPPPQPSFPGASPSSSSFAVNDAISQAARDAANFAASQDQDQGPSDSSPQAIFQVPGGPSGPSNLVTVGPAIDDFSKQSNAQKFPQGEKPEDGGLVTTQTQDNTLQNVAESMLDAFALRGF